MCYGAMNLFSKKKKLSKEPTLRELERLKYFQQLEEFRMFS